MTASSRTANAAACGLLLVLIAVTTTRIFVSESLWLDECVTWWISSADLATLIERAHTFQHQAPGYFVLPWLMQQLGGSSELALRIPSIAALALTSVLIFLFARKFLSIPLSLATVAIFFTSDVVLKSLSARPYGVGLLLGTIGFGAPFLIKSRWCWLISATFFAAACYCHSIFFPCAIALLAGQALVSHVHRQDALRAIAALTVLAAPIMLLLLESAASRTTLNFAGTPSVRSALTVLLPPASVAAVVTSVLLGLIVGGKDPSRRFFIAATLPWRLLLVAWLAPVALLGALSLGSGSNLVVDRYAILSIPALALILAGALASIATERGRWTALICLALMLIVRESERTWYLEDWRAALTRIPTHAPLLIDSGLVEGYTPEFLSNPINHPYLLTPVLRYAPKLSAIPFSPAIDDASVTELRARAVETLRRHTLVYVALQRPVRLSVVDSTRSEVTLRKILNESGAPVIRREDFGLVRLYEISPPAAHEAAE